MKVEFLGTGTSNGVPFINCDCEVCASADLKDKRLRCSAMVKVEGKNILIDCGPDFRQQALRGKISKIDALLLTHEHFDHVGGIDDLRAFGKVRIYAESRVAGAIRQMFAYCFAKFKYPGIPDISLCEIDERPFCADGVEIVPIRAYHHLLPLLGYRIGNFAYVTDIKTIDSENKAKLQGLDVLVLGMLRYKEHLSHLSFDEAMSLVGELKPKRTYFTHLSHDFGLHETEQAKLPENVFVAYDGLVIEC